MYLHRASLQDEAKIGQPVGTDVDPRMTRVMLACVSVRSMLFPPAMDAIQGQRDALRQVLFNDNHERLVEKCWHETMMKARRLKQWDENGMLQGHCFHRRKSAQACEWCALQAPRWRQKMSPEGDQAAKRTCEGRRPRAHRTDRQGFCWSSGLGERHAANCQLKFG